MLHQQTTNLCLVASKSTVGKQKLNKSILLLVNKRRSRFVFFPLLTVV